MKSHTRMDSNWRMYNIYNKEPGVFTLREEQLKLLYQRKSKGTSSAKVNSATEGSEKYNGKRNHVRQSGGNGQAKNPAGCGECGGKDHKKWWHN